MPLPKLATAESDPFKDVMVAQASSYNNEEAGGVKLGLFDMGMTPQTQNA